MTESQRKKIIIDTDVGIDDAQAILLALADLKTDVIAITCIGGNTSLENGNVEVSFKRTNSLTSLHIVCRNALKVLMIADRLEIPVFPGCTAPIIGSTKYGASYHGSDGLGDCEPPLLADVKLSTIQHEHAVNALSRLVKANPKEITIVCLGPLTNISVAIKMDAEITRYVKAIYVMGGNHCGGGNITPAAEFNFYFDPEAAHILLENCACPLTLVGWEVCSAPAATFETEWLEEYYNQTTPQGRFIHNTHRNLLARLRKQHESDLEQMRLVMCDEWLLAVFLDEKICKASREWLTRVELTGQFTRGQCVVDKRSHRGSDAAAGCIVRHVLELDIALMKAKLMSMAKLETFPKI